jgi:recombination protein RecR
MNIPSKLIQDAVNELSRLPGIGKKSALRVVLHLLKQPPSESEKLAIAIARMRNEICFCTKCHNVADSALCSICSNTKRNHKIVCVVENLRDIIAIENTHQFNGLYHVLGGVISPVEGIGPDALTIDSLVARIEKEHVEELIMALNPTIEGDTTIFYISKKVQHLHVKITTIARGVSFGGELEYTDEMTLGRAIANRQPYENYLVNRL